MSPKRRIESVDLLRGFTIAAMILVNNPGDWNHIYAPFRHAEWHGITPTDLIFPFFLFIVGISIYFAYRNKPKNTATYKKIGIRSLKLVALGIFLNWFLPFFPFLSEFESLRIPGVLQRIGIVFFISAIVFLNINRKGLIIVAITVLLVYWIFLGLVPLPDGTLPTYDRAVNNWANFIDFKILGNHMWQPDYDPEGLLSTLPSIVSCISGILVGMILGSSKSKKINQLLIIGVVLLSLGYLWSLWFPVNKALWSSSYVLVTSGWATVILVLIYFLTDIKKIELGQIFKYVGMNAIVIYFLSMFVTKSFYLIKVSENQNVHDWLYHSFFTSFLGDGKTASLAYAMTVTIFYLMLAFILYRKKIFIKV